MTTEDAIESLFRYRERRVPTGGFLQAVLANDLMEAFSRADETSRENLFEIVRWIYNNMPSNARGSYEKVDAWLK